MDDWGSFASGLLGALIGGGASFAVQLYVSNKETGARRRAAVERIDAATRALLRAGSAVTPGNPNTDEVFDAIQEGRAAITALRLVTNSREQEVPRWLAARMKRVTEEVMRDSERAMDAIRDAEDMLSDLAEWVAGRRKPKDLRV